MISFYTKFNQILGGTLYKAFVFLQILFRYTFKRANGEEKVIYLRSNEKDKASLQDPDVRFLFLLMP